jgi:hypothetical protein
MLKCTNKIPVSLFDHIWILFSLTILYKVLEVTFIYFSLMDVLAKWHLTFTKIFFHRIIKDAFVNVAVH